MIRDERGTFASEDEKYEIYLMAKESNKVCLKVEWIKDSGCTRHMMGNKSLFSSYKAFDGGNVVFGHGNSKIISKVRSSAKVRSHITL